MPKFQSITGLSKWLRGLLIANAVLALIGLLFSLMERSILARIAAAEETGLEDIALGALIADIERSDLQQMVIAFSQSGLALATVVLFCRWIFVASRNCHVISNVKLPISPGWSVGWFFVPIANLWKPYQAMRQTYNVSANPSGDAERDGPGFLLMWWIMFLVSNAVERVAFKQAMKAEEIPELQSLNTTLLLADAVYIPAVLLAFLLVSRIGDMQAKYGAGTPASKPNETQPNAISPA